MTRQDELRIHALGAAISRRDWHAVEQAHAAIRDAYHSQNGMTPTPAGRDEETIEAGCGCVFCDLDLTPTHALPNGQSVPCTNPALKSTPSLQGGPELEVVGDFDSAGIRPHEGWMKEAAVAVLDYVHGEAKWFAPEIYRDCAAIIARHFPSPEGMAAPTVTDAARKR